MEDKVGMLEALVAKLQKEVGTMKADQDGEASSTCEEGLAGKCRELQKKLDKIEGNLGVDKILLQDVGEKVMVVVQTPLGSVPVTLPHTSNTTVKPVTRGLEPSESLAPPYTGGGIKGGPPAGMTPEQLQDFKKQALQISQLQQKIKDLELRIQEANNLIKRGDVVTTDLTTKVSDDVTEIYAYLDEINTTMSQKIAEQRVEMEKLAGDTPQPINYDPFNYGEAYGGDVVDFEARKRIVEMDLLFQSLLTAMNHMKDNARVIPDIDLGYKVVRLDQLVEATGFGPAIREGELTTEDGLLISQAEEIEPPERRYPKNQAFQTDGEKEYHWSITDSIMQTMYRLEVELATLQSSVGNQEMNTKLAEEPSGTCSKPGKTQECLDESAIRFIIERECKHYLTTHNRPLDRDATLEKGSEQQAIEAVLHRLHEQFRQLEGQVNQLAKNKAQNRKMSHMDPYHQKKRSPTNEIPFNPFTCKNIHSFYRQPPRLRYLLQRVFRYQTPSDKHVYYEMPRLLGVSYEKAWPKTTMEITKQLIPHKTEKRVANIKADAAEQIKKIENITSAVEPQVQELMIKGKDGRWYRGDTRKTKEVSKKS